MNQRKIILIIAVLSLIFLSGCSDYSDNSADYEQAPDDIKDGSLDYQDYKESNCPYLDGSLDKETMDKCNKWISNQNSTSS